MRGGPQAIAYMMIISLILGLLVVLIHPDYRQTARDMLHGKIEQSPIWIDNEMYYPEITLVTASTDVKEEGANYNAK